MSAALLLISASSQLSEAWQPRSRAHLAALRLVARRSVLVAAVAGDEGAIEQWQVAIEAEAYLARQPRAPDAPRLPDVEARALFDVADAAALLSLALRQLARARGTAATRAAEHLVTRRISALCSVLS